MIVETDLRPSLNNVLDQGRRMACLSFATSCAHGRVAPVTADLSTEFLFYHSVQNMPGLNPDEGTTISATSKALDDHGQPIESDWPYLSMQRYGDQWVPPSNIGTTYKATLESEAPSMEGILAHLNKHTPVILGLIITDAFFQCDTDGLLPSLSPDIERAGHAVLAVGSGSDGANNFILVRNSWGKGWGLNGHAWLSESYLSKQLAEAATIS